MLAIKNAKIYTITKGVIDKGVLLVEGGKIAAVGRDVAIPEGTQVVDARGKALTPGLIDPHSHLAVAGQPDIWANSDTNEMSDPITPHLRCTDALNPRDMAIQDVLGGGVTAVYTGPGSANLIGGTGVAIKLRGRTVEEMIIPGTEGMKMALGENPKRCYGVEKKQNPTTRMGNAGTLREALARAKNYLAKKERAKDPKDMPDVDLKMEALAPVLQRKMKARIHCHRADDIMTAIRIAEEFNLDFVIEHATEGHLIADILGAKKVRCTIGPMLLERLKMEVVNISLKNPGILSRAGVKVGICCDETTNTRLLAICAGIAMREGMDEDDAFRAITITAAEILGLSKRIGSLEAGKDADLVIWSGYPLSSLSVAEKVYIEGDLVYQR